MFISFDSLVRLQRNIRVNLEIQFDPIGPMVRALRRAVDRCAPDLVPQMRAEKAIVQPQAMAG